MQCMLLIYADNSCWGDLSEDERTAIVSDYMSITEDPAVQADNRLAPRRRQPRSGCRTAAP